MALTIPDRKPIQIKKRIPTTTCFGAPGIGKTVFWAQYPNALFLTTDRTHDHVAIREIKINSFLEFIKVAEDIHYATAEQLDGVDVVVIDTITTLIDMCEQYAAKLVKAVNITEADMNSGYYRSKAEFSRGIGLIMNAKQSIALVMICHTEEKNISRMGQIHAVMQPDVQNYMKTRTTKHAAHVLFFTTKDELNTMRKEKSKKEYMQKSLAPATDQSERMIWSRPSFLVQAKDHYQVLPPAMPMNFDLYWAYLQGEAKWWKEVDDKRVIIPCEEEMERLKIREDYWNKEKK